ncbi:MAG: hypothetical protein CMJ31_12845 [Phycisphaerae bacterium]|nr:hypothetical protein [Phycisphaerae bacterium]
MEGSFAEILTLLGAVLIASVVGSAHCAGMCGGLALFAVGADGKLERRWRLHVGYHAGRGIGYAIVGAIAGWIGAAVDFAGLSAGWQRPAAAVAGATMIVFGLVAIGANLGMGVGGARVRLPARYQRFVESLHRFAFSLPPLARAWGVGFLTPALPCGWLYAFAIAAAGVGSPILGAFVMIAFWAGTLPMLGSVGFGLQLLTGPLRRRAPAITAGLVIVLGVLTATGRVSLPTFADPEAIASQPASIRASIQQVHTISADDLPCCNPEPIHRGSAEAAP